MPRLPRILRALVSVLALTVFCLFSAPAAAAPTEPGAQGEDIPSAVAPPGETAAALVSAARRGGLAADVKAGLDKLAGLEDLDRPRAVVAALLESPGPVAPTLAAELLLGLAEKKRLDDDLAARAAGLLGHGDPLVRALADWAISTRVENDNKGQHIAWPRADPPEWFRCWKGQSPEALVDHDYARFAILWSIHYDGQRMLDSVGAILGRARGAASEASKHPKPEVRARVARQLDQIESIRARLAEEIDKSPHDLTAHRRLWLGARRAARPIVLANPAVDFDRLVLVKAHAPHSHRNITGSQYPWVHKPGGGIYVQQGLEPGSPVREVLAGKLGPGHVHGIDLHWDADRVVFGYARQPAWPPKWNSVSGDYAFELRGEQEPTHLFEIGLDGSGLRQLTDHATWNDFEPTYCADGTIVFASDRSGRSSECGKFSADHTVINLYAIDADGGGLRRTSDNKDIDRYPHSLDNGLVAYTRWEYQERHFLEVHAVWTVRPDGTMSDALFKQHLRAPYGLRDARSVPGSSKLVAVATGHHTFAYGPLVLIDPHRGINAADAIRIVTPGVKPQEGPMGGEPVASGGVPDRGGLYHGPWALSETCFLVSYSYARRPSPAPGGANASGFALYLVDAYGNKELIHRDPVLSCFFPMPRKARPRPPVVPDVPQTDAPLATCYVADVYRGMEEVPRGTVKYLRVAQRVGWPLDEEIGAMRYIPGNAWEKKPDYLAWAPARVIGTVPVEKDGSACFRVPADTGIYFQALDAEHREVRRMRTSVTLQPGEVRGCTGCHETRASTPDPLGGLPLALRAEPKTPQAPPWGADRLLGYEWLVQPVLDRHCTRCHGADKAEGGIDLSAQRDGSGYVRSFRTILGLGDGDSQPRPKLISVSNRFDGGGVTRPLQFGSRKSRLVTVLQEDALHRKEVQLDHDEWLALVTWIDANAPYHDAFFNRRPAGGGPPRRDVRISLPDPFAALAPPQASRTEDSR